MKPTLLRWIFAPLWPVTIFSSIVLAASCLFVSSPLTEHHVLPVLIAAAFTAFTAWRTGRFASRGAGFLHTRGFTGHDLWLNTFLANTLAALILWLPSAVIVATPLRSAVQNALESPYYPLFYPAEYTAPFSWLIPLVAFVPAMHYAALRKHQPSAAPESGLAVAGAVTVAALCWANVPGVELRHVSWFPLVPAITATIIAIVLTKASKNIYHTLEVSS